MAAVNRMNAPAGLVNGGGLEEFENDVEALIWENQQQRRSKAAAVERERELNIFRSGSAPPTVEGSWNAISSLFGGPGVSELNGYDSGSAISEEEMRSHPAYLSYYYSNEKLNPRLPPPALSKEDWRTAQRFQVGPSTFARTGDRRREVVGVGIGDGSSGSLFSLHPGFHMRDVDGELAERRIGSQMNSARQAPPEWVERGSDGLLGFGSGTRRKSFADALQNPRITSVDFAGNHARNSPLSQRAPTLRNSQIDAGGIGGQYLNSNGDLTVSGIQAPLVEPLFAQQLQRTHSFPDSTASLGRNLVGSSQMDMSAYQKAYLKALLAHHKLQYELPFLGKSGAFLNNGYYDTLASSLQYPINPIASSILPSLGSLSPPRHGDKLSHFPSTMKSSAGASVGSWSSEYGVVDEGFALSLLEEFKSNKSRSFELLDIVGHVVEFSADQYGSRFIQQKLETASIEEKNKIFPEIFPHARALMTDVFGNYVIQKFLEHGSESQKKQLSSQLIGHVLPLSLQMYGCRVIQKALEVVDADQQNQIVLELDGSIMKCVRDQNGNHVIQKCIECVPQERIQFIISGFYGQVVPLSTHPYGCRVIQRVLEHCNDAKTQSIMMDEILQAVCALAQDQYGNYVVQHVLQHGKPQERSAIINKLAGQIVKMSQQKFASNVVEKCLTYGAPEERQLLINEMLGSTDENEPLQAMMKDQFGNYVVQKALETCDDKNRELILSRIKAHVSALKRYTYGKHIAARVEKVIAAGERRMSMPSCTP